MSLKGGVNKNLYQRRLECGNSPRWSALSRCIGYRSTVLGKRDVEQARSDTDSTYILVRNDFDILHMTCRLEYLSQHLLGHSWI